MEGKRADDRKDTDLKIEITDYYVMLSLHKALLEAKFHQNPDNTEVAFSPMVADFCNMLLDKLTQLDAAKDAERSKMLRTGTWSDWRMLANQPFYRERAVDNALRNNRWDRMRCEEKRKAVKNLLSPFWATEEEIECFIQEVDEKYQRGGA